MLQVSISDAYFFSDNTDLSVLPSNVLISLSHIIVLCLGLFVLPTCWHFLLYGLLHHITHNCGDSSMIIARIEHASRTATIAKCVGDCFAAIMRFIFNIHALPVSKLILWSCFQGAPTSRPLSFLFHNTITISCHDTPLSTIRSDEEWLVKTRRAFQP